MMDIAVDSGLCIRCFKCIQVCPSSLFSSREAVVYADHPERCILCGHCIDVCPRNAIRHSEFPASSVHDVHKGLLPDSDSLMHLIKIRRSTRVFRPEPVPENCLELILQAAHAAPTARNAQKVEFTLVTSSEMIEKVVDTVINIYKDNLKLLKGPFTRPLVSMLMPDKLQFIPLLERLVASREKGKDPILHGARALLLIHGPKKNKLVQNDCNLAYQNASLEAEALGIGQFYTGFLYMAGLNDRKRRLCRLLDIGGDIYAGMALGVPAVEYLRYVDRKEMVIRRW